MAEQKPTREELASLLAALHYGQYSTAEDERNLRKSINRALRNFDIGLAEFQPARVLRPAYGVGEVHPCPLGKGCQPDPNCTNRAQCWEPCGLLGNDEKHVRAASAKDTAAINKALGVTACPHGVPHRWPCEKCDAPGVAALEPHPPSRKCGCAACAPSFASDDVSVQSEQPLASLPREAMPEGGKQGENR